MVLITVSVTDALRRSRSGKQARVTKEGVRCGVLGEVLDQGVLCSRTGSPVQI